MTEQTTKEKRAIISKNLRGLMKEHKIDTKELADIGDVDYDTAADWLTGKSMPTEHEILILAAWLGATTDYITEDHRELYERDARFQREIAASIRKHPINSNPEERTHRIVIKLTDSEEQLLARQAQRENYVTLNSFIRRKIIDYCKQWP